MGKKKSKKNIHLYKELRKLGIKPKDCRSVLTWLESLGINFKTLTFNIEIGNDMLTVKPDKISKRTKPHRGYNKVKDGIVKN